jgi:coenzyme PQQ synthesis protein D (PqqD)
MIFVKRAPIQNSSLVRRVDGVTATQSADGLFLVDAKGGRLFSLNASGRAIWEGLDQPSRVEELCRRLVSEFTAEPEMVRRDVLFFLDSFLRAKLIQDLEHVSR